MELNNKGEKSKITAQQKDDWLNYDKYIYIYVYSMESAFRIW